MSSGLVAYLNCDINAIVTGIKVKTAALGQLLKDLDFPADKNNIIQFIQQSQQPSNITTENKQEILSLLQEHIKEGNQCQNVSEVTRAARVVQQ